MNQSRLHPPPTLRNLFLTFLTFRQWVPGPVALILLLGACQPATVDTSIPSRIYVLGVDALSFPRVQALVDEGRLPHFERIMSEGSYGSVEVPLPMDHITLWTCVLTGRLPHNHQVVGQMTSIPNGPRTITPSSLRKNKNLWQMLSDSSELVASVGFPGTWPAGVVNGFVASNCYTETRWTETAENTFNRVPGVADTYPVELLREIRPHVKTVSELERETASRFFHLRENEFEMLYDLPLGSVMSFENPLRDFGLTVQSDRSNMDVGFYLADTYDVRCVGIYLELLSALQPVYWAFLYPSAFSPPAEHYRRFRETVNEGYVFIDDQIGRILDRMTERDVLVVVSDHGFQTGAVTDADGNQRPVPVNSQETALFLYGHAIRDGGDVGSVQITDVTPTILALLGHDVAADLDGSVLREAIQPEFLAAHPPSSIESYDTDWDRTQRYPPIADSPDDDTTELLSVTH